MSSQEHATTLLACLTEGLKRAGAHLSASAPIGTRFEYGDGDNSFQLSYGSICKLSLSVGEPLVKIASVGLALILTFTNLADPKRQGRYVLIQSSQKPDRFYLKPDWNASDTDYTFTYDWQGLIDYIVEVVTAS